MSGKEYYENPFDNDDDDTCFATIELDVDDDTSPNHTGFSSRKRSSQYAQMTPNQSAGILQVRSRGASMKQSGHSDHSRRSLHYADDGEVEERSVGRVVVPATNLRSQLTNERSSATRRSVTRGNMDPTSQEAIHQVESSYEEIVQSLRSTLTEMQGENSLLRNEKHKLESQLRAVRLEKENCEFNLQKEKNRSAILEEQVQALEEELASMQTIRHQEVNQQRESQVRSQERPSASRVKPPPPAVYVAAPLEAPAREKPQTTNVTTANTSVEEHDVGSRRRPLRNGLEPTAKATPSHARGARSNESHFNIFQQQYDENDETNSQSGSRGPLQRRRLQDSEPVQRSPPQPRGQPSQPTIYYDPSDMAREARNNAELTEKQKNENYNKHIASVEVLEAELLEHSIARDELQGALQRLDNTRTRSVADRARKVTVERQLEEEERMIGHIRLQIRNLGR